MGPSTELATARQRLHYLRTVGSTTTSTSKRLVGRVVVIEPLRQRRRHRASDELWCVQQGQEQSTRRPAVRDLGAHAAKAEGPQP